MGRQGLRYRLGPPEPHKMTLVSGGESEFSRPTGSIFLFLFRKKREFFRSAKR
jgi:hypothetical protein